MRDAATAQNLYDDTHAGLIKEIESAAEPMDILRALGRRIALETVYMWVMLPLERGEREIYVVSRYPWPRDNAQSLVEEFLLAARRTASDHEVDLPPPDVLDVHYASLEENGDWTPMDEPAIAHVGVVARRRLRAIVRAYALEDPGDLQETVAAATRTVAPYLDATLLARRNDVVEERRDRTEFMDSPEFRETIRQEISRIRKSPHEMSLLRIKLMVKEALTDGDSLDEAMDTARALIESTVRQGDVLGMLNGSDIGVLMPYTGPRNALIGAMRISDALDGNQAVSRVLDHYIGLSGWAISGSDTEGLLIETEQAARQAQYASQGPVQLFM
jgi:GGDEF domain-containing protein